jgi:RNA polymerase sigma-70 factor (ECF subfamily)
MKTAEMHDWLSRIRNGDRQALDSLLKRVSARLERLVRKMVKRFPRVSRWTEPEDVLQTATLKFIAALQEIRPNSMREFYGLAAIQIRRELLDLTRKFYGPEGLGNNHASVNPDDSAAAQKLDPVSDDRDDAELEKWCDFHREVELLPAEEREVVGLIFYHGWKQKEVANLLDVAVKTVQRRWATALGKLKAHLSDWPVTND